MNWFQDALSSATGSLLAILEDPDELQRAADGSGDLAERDLEFLDTVFGARGEGQRGASVDALDRAQPVKRLRGSGSCAPTPFSRPPMAIRATWWRQRFVMQRE